MGLPFVVGNPCELFDALRTREVMSHVRKLGVN